MRCILLLAVIVTMVNGDHFPLQECVIDVGFVMDGSGSVTSDNWVLMLAFVQRFARHVHFNQSGTRIGVVSYGNTGTVNIGLDDYTDVLLFENAVKVIPYKDENTNTAAGIRALRTEVFNVNNGDRPASPNVAVVMTDGESTWEANNTIPEASAIKDTGAKIFAIGIGEKINQDEVDAIASDPDTDFVRTVDEFSDLDSLVELIVNSTCEVQRETTPIPTSEAPTTTTTTSATTPTTTTTTSTTTTPPTTTTTTPATTTTTTTTTTTPPPTTTTTTAATTTTTTTQPTTTTTTIATTTTTTTPAPTTTSTTQRTTTTTRSQGPVIAKMDVAFLLDSSGSIGFGNWILIKQFVKQMVEPWTLSANDIRVAVIAYSTESFLRIELGQYDSHSEFNIALDNMIHLNQRTNTSGAIRMTYQSVLNLASRRPDARQVAVIVTDGDSNTDQHHMETEARQARQLGIQMFAVGVGNTTSMSELRLAASKPYYHFIHMMAEYTDLITAWYTIGDALTLQSYPPETMDISYQDCPATVVLVVDVPADLSNAVHAYVDGYMDALQAFRDDGQMALSSYKASTSRGGRQSDKNVQGDDLSDALYNLRNNLLGRDNGPQFVFTILMSGNYGDADILEDQVEALKNENVKITIVPIGDATTDEVLIELCSEPKTSTFSVQEGFESLLRNNSNNLDFLRDRGRQTQEQQDLCKLAAEELWTCSFEDSESYRCSMKDDHSEEFTWTLYSLQTPSRHTGPDYAHHGQYYMYTEASKPRKNGDTAVMYLPFTADGDFCLSFYYHMFGWHIGVLDVLVLSGDQEHITWRMVGQQGPDWRYAQTLLQLRDGDRIGIRGIRAKEFSGDIGLDSIRIKKGPCLGAV